MAKAIKVERLRDSGLTVTQPNIRPVDTFVNVAAANPNDYVNTELSNFLSQLSPKLQQYGANKQRAEEEMQMMALQEMSYVTQDGKYKTLEEVRASGEFVPSNPTVAFAYNKGLGAEIGKNIQAELFSRYEEGIQNKSLQGLDPVQFRSWIAEQTQDALGGYKEYTNSAGVTAGIKSFTGQVEQQLIGQQMSEARKYASSMVTEAFNRQAEASLYGVDLTTPEAVATSLNQLADNLYSADSAFTGAEINEKMAGFVADKLNVSQDPNEIGAFIVAARQLKAGSGNLEGTKHWSDKSLDEVINVAIARKDAIEQAQYYRKVRSENNENEQLRSEIIEHIENGGVADDFQPRGNYSQVDVAETAAMFKSVENQLRNDTPMTDELFVEAHSYFSKLTPYEAEVHMNEIIAGERTPFGTLSLSQKQALGSISRSASQTGYEVFESPAYKDILKDVATKYEVWDAYGKDIRTFVEPEAQAYWQQAEVELERMWIAINRSPTLLGIYLDADTFNNMVAMSGGDGINLQRVLRNPDTKRQLQDALIQQMIARKPPSELSAIMNTGQVTVGEGGQQVIETTNSAGEQIQIKVTPRDN